MSGQLVDEPAGRVDGFQSFHDRSGVDRDGSGHPIVIAEIEDQRLDVAVEDQSDDFIVAIHHGAAGVPADDVCRGYEVEGGLECQPTRAAGIEPAFGKLVRGLVAVRAWREERPRRSW